MLQSFKAGTETLKNYLSNKEFSIENIEKTMDDLNETLADSNELENAMQIPTCDDDNEEIEMELDLLIKNEKNLKMTGVTNDQATDDLIMNLNNLEIMSTTLPETMKNDIKESKLTE